MSTLESPMTDAALIAGLEASAAECERGRDLTAHISWHAENQLRLNLFRSAAKRLADLSAQPAASPGVRDEPPSAHASELCEHGVRLETRCATCGEEERFRRASSLVRGADRMAQAAHRLVERSVISSRSPLADALLDYACERWGQDTPFTHFSVAAVASPSGVGATAEVSPGSQTATELASDIAGNFTAATLASEAAKRGVGTVFHSGDSAADLSDSGLLALMAAKLLAARRDIELLARSVASSGTTPETAE